MIRFATPFAAVALVLAASSCGSEAPETEGPTVSATTGVLADITRQVAGPDAEVVQLIPEGTSAHEFQLSARERAAVGDSVLLVHNGSGLESGIPVDEIGVERFALSDNAGELLGSDPHVWMDPTRVASALPALASTLADADPEHAAGYRRRAKAYAAKLAALDTELEGRLATVPADARELVTSHDALAYFAARYGFEVVATAFPASGPEAAASAAGIDEVAAAVRRTRTPALFGEREDDPEVLELVAAATGARVIPDLLVESPAGAGGYAAMLRRDAELIAEALAPAGVGPRAPAP